MQTERRVHKLPVKGVRGEVKAQRFLGAQSVTALWGRASALYGDAPVGRFMGSAENPQLLTQNSFPFSVIACHKLSERIGLLVVLAVIGFMLNSTQKKRV